MTSSSTAVSNAIAVWFPRPGSVELRHETLPDLGPRDILVEAIASAISHGTEMLVFRGQVAPDLELDLPTLRGGFSFPIKYGYASVGRVVDRGPDAQLRIGDVVFVHHPHQSRYVVADTLPIVLSSGVEPGLGVFLANVETAVNIALDAGPRLGERVAIFGQGVVGLLLTQLLLRAGADVTVVEPMSMRRELAVQFGAHAGLSGEYDLAIEASGNAAALQQAIDSLAFGGTVVVASWYGTKSVKLTLGGDFHRRRLRIISSQVGTIDAALQPRWTHQRRLQFACELLAQLQLARLISHRIPFERAAEAYQLVSEHPEETVQVVFTYV
jgi:2-desacetyl-2-hydroxyethyl bacteriochlorophyllide A dehydrogenase